ncbi:thrombospondin-type laminin G domain and EAR repeat-containing protein-like [Littorina saxatilis]|uniref:thrombospondin-type laminin G domain and EAR repeat-containing protein-like n=1 Tax=Littorina saxatilis TaxID=31220 RepID=UPI0038B423F4
MNLSGLLAVWKIKSPFTSDRRTKPIGSVEHAPGVVKSLAEDARSAEFGGGGGDESVAQCQSAAATTTELRHSTQTLLRPKNINPYHPPPSLQLTLIPITSQHFLLLPCRPPFSASLPQPSRRRSRHFEDADVLEYSVGTLEHAPPRPSLGRALLSVGEERMERGDFLLCLKTNISNNACTQLSSLVLAGLKPVDLLEVAVPTLEKLPAGVSVMYDTHSHVHGFQFSRDASDIYFRASKLFPRCRYFPYEFSVFVSMKVTRRPRREECILSLYDERSRHRVISVVLARGKMVFQFKDKRYKFKTNIYKDKQWHTYGFSLTAGTLEMSTDCGNKRRRVVRFPFPTYLPITNSSISIGRCKKRRTIFQGLLKDVILVTGGDASVRACPPKVKIQPGLDNFITTFPGYRPLAQFRYGSSQCEWTDVGNIAFDIYTSKLKVCVNGVWREVNVNTGCRRLDYLVPHQQIDTGAESLDVEIFDIPGEGRFAAFANAAAVSGSPSASAVFKWVDGKFEIYQRLETKSAQSWEFFEIRNQFFLAVANYGTSTMEPTNSTVYKWRKRRKKFKPYQQIATWTARDMEHFAIEDDHYLAVANHAEGDKNLIDSVIYKWDDDEREFGEHQRIMTVGAYDWTHFSVDGFHFLVVANAFNGLSTLIDSAVYFFQDGQFVKFQTMETNGATDWEFFKMGKEAFLVVANAYNYGPQNYQDIDSYATNSTIYRLNIAKRVFEKYQSFPTFSAIDWEYMQIGSDHYLIVSNAQNGGNGDHLKSVIYRWQGVDRFVPVHHMVTQPNADFDVFRDKEDIYLVYASAKSPISEVLKVKFV